MEKTRKIKDISVLTAVLSSADADTLRIMTDQFKQGIPSGCAVLGSEVEDRPILIAAITDDLVARGLNAIDLVLLLLKKSVVAAVENPPLRRLAAKIQENWMQHCPWLMSTFLKICKIKKDRSIRRDLLYHYDHKQKNRLSMMTTGFLFGQMGEKNKIKPFRWRLNMHSQLLARAKLKWVSQSKRPA